VTPRERLKLVDELVQIQLANPAVAIAVDLYAESLSEAQDRVDEIEAMLLANDASSVDDDELEPAP
jgi:hypothetical protein